MTRDDERRIAALELAIKYNPNADPHAILSMAEMFYRWMRRTGSAS